MTKKTSQNSNNEPPEVTISNFATDGLMLSSLTISEFMGSITDGKVDLGQCAENMRNHYKSVEQGDLSSIEAILTGQTLALNTLFTTLAFRSKQNMGEYFDAADKYMRLALRAQNQCRSTAETLATIKNPKPFIQHNNAQYQQVNNGNGEASRAGENQKQPNELLRDNDGQTMDTSGTTTPSLTHSPMEAMEPINGTKEPAGERC